MGKFYPDGCDFWMREHPGEPGFPTDVRSLHLARALLHFGRTRVRADVWLIDGGIRLIEYGPAIKQHVEEVAERVTVKLKYEADGEPAASASLDPIPVDSLPPGWLRDLCLRHEGVELFRPDPELEARIARLSVKPSAELIEFWQLTDGLSWRELNIGGISNVHERTLDGKRWVLLGALEADLIVIRKSDPEQKFILLYHDIPPETLGPSFRTALTRLFEIAS